MEVIHTSSFGASDLVLPILVIRMHNQSLLPTIIPFVNEKSRDILYVDSVTLLGGLNEQTIPIIFESILLTYAGNHMIKEDFS